MDGVSLAASIAGLASLGIQVTQALVDYYSAWRTQHASVTSTIQKLKHLSETLEILRNQSASHSNLSDDQKLLNAINGYIQGCKECISELQTECDKFKKGDSTDGLRSFARTSARRIAYPFRQSTLQKLDEDIDEFVSQLSLALQVLGQKSIDKVQDDIEDIKALLDLVRASQVSTTIRNWLRAPDASINYNEACKKRHSRTGLWLPKSPSYSSWLVEANSFLWLYGFAGCGKSVLCSTAIQYAFRHRRSNPRIGIAFFFFTFNDDAKQDVSAMLRALVLQLSGQADSNKQILSQLYDSHLDSTPPDQALIDCLQQLVRSFDNTYIILDALDESPRDKHRADVMQALIDMHAWSEPALHLLVTSRDEVDIRDVLVKDVRAAEYHMISLRNESIDRDIASFVSGAMKNDRRLRRWERHHDQIEEALTKGANGVFRWVECQFTALDSCPRSKRHLDILLKSLPRSLDKTYEQMLSRISKESVDEARRLLTLLCCAKRPLTVPEVIDGIAVDIGDNPGLNIDDRLESEEDLYQICPGLIEIDFVTRYDDDSSDGSRGVSAVRIAHFSVQEYLESERIHQHIVASFGVRRREAHAEVASICLAYLLDPKPVLHDPRYPLSIYAAQHWFEHYRDGDEQLYHVYGRTIQLFRSTGHFEKWARTWNVDEVSGKGPEGKIASPIYYASLLGLESILSELLCERHDLINVQGGYHDYALQAAIFEGHEKIVQLLIDKGADVNLQGRDYGNALYAASLRGYEGIVQLLIDKGADVDLLGGPYKNALHEASYQGHEKIVQLLIEKGADVNLQGRDYGSALQAASLGGHEKIMQLLIRSGADVNAQGERRGTALQTAAIIGNEEIVRLLIDNGANVNAPGGAYGRALQAASLGSHEKIVQLLLEYGAV